VLAVWSVIGKLSLAKQMLSIKSISIGNTA